jgi:hypothetical protein
MCSRIRLICTPSVMNKRPEHQVGLFAATLRFGAVVDQLRTPLAQPLQGRSQNEVSEETNLYSSYVVTKMHMGVQARPKPVDEGHRTDMHRRLVKPTSQQRRQTQTMGNRRIGGEQAARERRDHNPKLQP